MPLRKIVFKQCASKILFKFYFYFSLEPFLQFQHSYKTINSPLSLKSLTTVDVFTTKWTQAFKLHHISTFPASTTHTLGLRFVLANLQKYKRDEVVYGCGCFSYQGYTSSSSSDCLLWRLRIVFKTRNYRLRLVSGFFLEFIALTTL